MIALNRVEERIRTEPLLTSSLAEEDGPGLNILVLGSDSRELTTERYGKDDGAQRSDSMLLVHLSQDDSRISAVQIPRDTLVEAPQCTGRASGTTMMINSALNAGPACSVQAAEELTGVPIQHFALVDFDGFASVIDAIGGLPVRLDAPMKDTAADLDLPAGDQVLDGRQALAWARARHSIGDGSDISRLSHQQEVIAAIVDRVREQNLLTRPDRVLDLADSAAEALTVDSDLGTSAALASVFTRLAQVDANRITVVTMPWQPAPEDPNRVVPSPEAATLFADIRKDVPVTG
ncbi:hypothetical protein GCM10009700_14290 [Brevibacterium sanguinis]